MVTLVERYQVLARCYSVMSVRLCSFFLFFTHSMQADILQLDVMWLFDSFQGNSSDKIDLTGDCMLRCGSGEGRAPWQIVPWKTLQSMPLVSAIESSRVEVQTDIENVAS